MEWLTDKRTGTQTGLLLIIGLVVLDIFCLIAMTAASRSARSRSSLS